MPIRSHLGGQHFDPETIRLMGIAFEMALVSLQRTDGSINPTRAAVAQKIIELAKAGERDPGRLCDATLEAFGTSFRSAPVISDFARVPAYSSSELISGRPSDARALASISACSHCLRVRLFR